MLGERALTCGVEMWAVSERAEPRAHEEERGGVGLLALAACGGMGRAGVAGPRGEKGCCWAAVKRRAMLGPGRVVLGRVQRGRGERCCQVVR